MYNLQLAEDPNHIRAFSTEGALWEGRLPIRKKKKVKTQNFPATLTPALLAQIPWE